jgi:Carboxypeptidase regulatory-like domain
MFTLFIFLKTCPSQTAAPSTLVGTFMMTEDVSADMPGDWSGTGQIPSTPIALNSLGGSGPIYSYIGGASTPDGGPYSGSYQAGSGIVIRTETGTLGGLDLELDLDNQTATFSFGYDYAWTNYFPSMPDADTGGQFGHVFWPFASSVNINQGVVTINLNAVTNFNDLDAWNMTAASIFTIAGELTSAFSTIGGHVYCTCDNSSISGALVQIGDHFATTDSEGNYSIKNIPVGTYSVNVSHPDYYSKDTTATIAPGSAGVISDVTLTPNGSDIVGRLKFMSESLLRISTGPPESADGRDTTKIADFQPEPNLNLTIDQGACLLGFDHFNWLQIVTYDPQYLIFSPVQGYIDPPQLLYNHLNNDGTINEKGVAIPNELCSARDSNGDCTSSEPADGPPFYWNEQPNGPQDPFYYKTQISADGTTLHFQDQPTDPFLQSGEKRTFITWLVGVRGDSSYDILTDGFYWESTYRGATSLGKNIGGVTAALALETGGTGGLSAVATNIQAGNLSERIRSQIMLSGGAFPVRIEPVAQAVAAGANVTLAISPTNSSSLLNYQWQQNGTNIAGATNATLQLQNVSTNSTGIYDVVLSNISGAISSAPATVTVLNVPLFEFPILTTDGQLTLSWIAPTGNKYQLQYTTNLSQPNWVSLGDIFTATNTVVSTTTTLGSDQQRFYRVQQQ